MPTARFCIRVALTKISSIAARFRVVGKGFAPISGVAVWLLVKVCNISSRRNCWLWGFRTVKSTAYQWFVNVHPLLRFAAVPQYLKNSQIHDILRNPPCVGSRHIVHSRDWYLSQVEPSIVVPRILDHLCSPNCNFTHITQEVPEAEL